MATTHKATEGEIDSSVDNWMPAVDLIQVAAMHGIEEQLVQLMHASDLSVQGMLAHGESTCIACPERLNKIQPLNAFVRAVHAKLREGGYFICVFEPMTLKYRRLWDRYPAWLARLRYWIDYSVKRVIPGLAPRHRLFAFLNQPRYRVLSTTEALGRLVYCGFKIVDYKDEQNCTYVIAKKTVNVSVDPPLSFGPLLRLQRIGQGGKPISVFKLRTMHPYAQYLQGHIQEKYGLREGGKLRNDFRTTPWGRKLRKLWIDEIPMLINVLIGDLKLVGVRPLSPQYLALYCVDVREKRLRHKPGLVPPFYADLPSTFEEIMDSEMRYLDAYESNPLKTDLIYLVRALHNIVVRHARSN